MSEMTMLKRLAWWWLAFFGVWPLADPGHGDLSSPLVWLDLILHTAAISMLLSDYVARRVQKALDAPRTVVCRNIDLFTSDGQRVESITITGSTVGSRSNP